MKKATLGFQLHNEIGQIYILLALFFSTNRLKLGHTYWVLPRKHSINEIIQEKFRENNNSNLQNVIKAGLLASVLHVVPCIFVVVPLV